MEDDGGLFAIEVSDSSDSETTTPKVPRDYQSLEDFEAQKAAWNPKIENGELWKTLKLPVDDPSKMFSQNIMHAIEELYFLQRYQEAEDITAKALEGKLSGDFRKILEGYLQRCHARLQKNQ